MIIRMTVQDNDFTGVIEDFVEKYWFELMPDTILLEKVYELWNQYLLKDFNYSEYDDGDDDELTREYLLNNFEASLSCTFTDKWENGEVVYYFNNAHTWLTQ